MEGFLGLPFDVLAVIALLAVLLLYNYTLGKHRAATLLLSLYVAGAVMMFVPIFDVAHEVLPLDPRLTPVALFFLVLAAVFFVLRRNAFFDPYLVPTGWELGLFSVLHASLIVVILVSLEPASVTVQFSPNFSRIFLDPLVRSTLIAGPLVLLALFRGRE